jgi:uncharacterized membrane protein
MLKPLPVTTPLPSHVEEAIQAMAAMHAAHRKQASSMERWIDQVIFVIARPIFPVYIVCFLIVWIGAGFLAAHEGLPVLDQAPYPTLALSVSCAALFIAVLILASQRRADRLTNLREQMTLETVLLTTQKASKLIDLIEELRRDIVPVAMGAFVGKGLTMKTGQTHVQKYLGPLMKHIVDGEIDPSFLITHRVSLEEGPEAYKTFRDKKEGCIKVVIRPNGDGRG